MTSPLVSVIVPSRGGAARLPVLFDALRAQRSTDWEAIIVIDGDIDDSQAVVAAASRDLPVQSITFTSNRGRSAALNAGFAAARGHVLVRCDDDLVPSENYVLDHGLAHGEKAVGVVGLYRNVYPETTYARVYGRTWDKRFRQEAYLVPTADNWRYWAGNVSVTRDTWARVGPYDTRFRAYGWEDVDWGYRLVQSGVPVVLEPMLETEHRIAATTTAMRTQRAYYSGAARRRFETKHDLVLGAGSSVSAWDRVARGVARGLDERRALVLGSAIDRGSRILPARATGKLVALAIDASARAGYAVGQTAGAI